MSSQRRQTPLLHREATSIHDREELRLRSLVQHDAAGIHFRHRKHRHVVHLLSDQEERDLVAILVKTVVLYHGVRKLLHRRLVRDSQVAQTDVRHGLVALPVDRDRLDGTMRHLVGCYNAGPRLGLLFGEIDRSLAEIRRDKLVIVAATIASTAEGELQVRRQHLIQTNDVGPLHALFLLTIGLRVGRLGDLLRHYGLTTVLLEGKATY